MYLLSNFGERHEDRIPLRIVSSIDEARDLIKKHFVDYSFREEKEATDYDEEATIICVYYGEGEDEEIECVVIVERINEEL